MFVHYVQKTSAFDPKQFFLDVKGLLTGTITTIDGLSDSCNKTTSWLKSDPSEAPTWEYVKDVWWNKFSVTSVANLTTLSTARQGDIAIVNTSTPAYYSLRSNSPSVSTDWVAVTVADYNYIDNYNGMRGVFRQKLSDDSSKYKYMTVSVGKQYTSANYGIDIYAHDTFDANDDFVAKPWVNGYYNFGYSFPFVSKSWNRNYGQNFITTMNDANPDVQVRYCPGDKVTWASQNNSVDMKMNNNTFFVSSYFALDYSMLHGVTERTRIGKWDTLALNSSIFGSFNSHHTSSATTQSSYISNSNVKFACSSTFNPKTTAIKTALRTTTQTDMENTINLTATTLLGLATIDPQQSCDENMLPIYDLFEMSATGQGTSTNCSEGGNISKASKIYRISSSVGNPGDIVKYGLDEYMVHRSTVTDGTSASPYAYAIKLS
jgi:hypothetical protein